MNYNNKNTDRNSKDKFCSGELFGWIRHYVNITTRI